MDHLYACAALLAGAALAGAGSMPVENHSFEADALADGEFYIGHAPGWTVSGSAGIWNPTAQFYPDGVPEGELVAFVNRGASMWQNLGVEAEAGMSYELSVLVGNRAHYDPSGGFIVELLVGGNVAASLTNESPSDDIPIGTFREFTLDWTAGDDFVAGQELGVRFSGITSQTNFDDVRLVSVPAPGALAPLAMLGLMRRRR